MALKTFEDYLWDAHERGITDFQMSVENAVDAQLEIHLYSTQKEEISLSYKVEGNNVYLVDDPAGFKQSDDFQA